MVRTTRAPIDREVVVPIGALGLPGRLTIPSAATGLVGFAHGSGSSRLSRRNRFVAEQLHRGGLGTLLFDLLTEEEGLDRHQVFDIPLLAGRMTAAVRWLAALPEVHGLRIGLFGASTGAAAALVAAAELPDLVSACVSRGGRPDLAGDRLLDVAAPTLLIVGGDDEPVVGLNRWALTRLMGTKRLVVIPGATHLFEEPGTLEEVATLAAAWFDDHLTSR